jgi:hypothetical protein
MLPPANPGPTINPIGNEFAGLVSGAMKTQ